MKFSLRVGILGVLVGCTMLHAQSGYPVNQGTRAAEPHSSQQQREEAQPITQANVPGSPYIEREFRMPVPGSGSQGLDVLEVYYNAPGKHPLALVTHGTSNVASEREQLTPWMYLSQAVWFAERGYVALAIIRRGYGSSGGEQDGVHGGCKPGGDFEQTGKASADDLRNAAAYAQAHLPEVDASRVVSVGVSTGGFAQVALTANPPSGLKAAISFAGGRGGDGDGHLCNEADFLHALQAFGKRSHTPMLWIYAQNDKWFPPHFAREFQAAFERGGGTDEFLLAPPHGEDGHHLFNDVAAWSATVDHYLSEHGLLPLSAPHAPPPIPNMLPPDGLGEHGKDAFRNFLSQGPKKAFATNGNSWYGYSYGQLTQKLADQHALDTCNKVRRGGPVCFIAAR